MSLPHIDQLPAKNAYSNLVSGIDTAGGETFPHVKLPTIVTVQERLQKQLRARVEHLDTKYRKVLRKAREKIAERMEPEEWRLPNAPLPARPDYSRTCPSYLRPPFLVNSERVELLSSMYDTMAKNNYYGLREKQYFGTKLIPPLPVEQYLRSLDLLHPTTILDLQNSSYKQASLYRTVYYPFVNSSTLHPVHRTEVDIRERQIEIPKLCYGCRRSLENFGIMYRSSRDWNQISTDDLTPNYSNEPGACINCQLYNDPHASFDKPVKTGGGYHFVKRGSKRNKDKSIKIPGAATRGRISYDQEFEYIVGLGDEVSLLSSVDEGLGLSGSEKLQEPEHSAQLPAIISIEVPEIYKQRINEHGGFIGGPMHEALVKQYLKEVGDSSSITSGIGTSLKSDAIGLVQKFQETTIPTENQSYKNSKKKGEVMPNILPVLDRENLWTPLKNMVAQAPNLYQPQRSRSTSSKKLTVAKDPFSKNRTYKISKGGGLIIHKSTKKLTKPIGLNPNYTTLETQKKFEPNIKSATGTRHIQPKVLQKIDSDQIVSPEEKNKFIVGKRTTSNNAERSNTPDSGVELISTDTPSYSMKTAETNQNQGEERKQKTSINEENINKPVSANLERKDSEKSNKKENNGQLFEGRDEKVKIQTNTRSKRTRKNSQKPVEYKKERTNKSDIMEDTATMTEAEELEDTATADKNLPVPKVSSSNSSSSASRKSPKVSEQSLSEGEEIEENKTETEVKSDEINSEQEVGEIPKKKLLKKFSKNKSEPIMWKKLGKKMAKLANVNLPTTQNVEEDVDTRDPLDFLAKYCIVYKERIPLYQKIFSNFIQKRNKQETGNNHKDHRKSSIKLNTGKSNREKSSKNVGITSSDQDPGSAVKQEGETIKNVFGPDGNISDDQDNDYVSPMNLTLNEGDSDDKNERRKRKLMKLIQESHFSGTDSFEARDYINKLQYTMKQTALKGASIQENINVLEEQRKHIIAEIIKQEFPELIEEEMKKVNSKSAKKRKKVKEKPSNTGEVIMTREGTGVDLLNDSEELKRPSTPGTPGMLKFVRQAAERQKLLDSSSDDWVLSLLSKSHWEMVETDTEVERLDLEIERAGEKLADVDKRIMEIKEENIKMEQFENGIKMLEDDSRASKSEEFRRKQSAKYTMMNPVVEHEMDIQDIELALKQLNSNLLTEKEVQYIFYLLDLPQRKRINFKLFTVVAALSEKVSRLEPFIKKIINKLNFEALVVKMDRAKEMFHLLDDEDEDQKKGIVTIKSLTIELAAGGLSNENIKFVANKFNREGKGTVDFLDYLTYIPLFIDIHENICVDPLNVERNR